MGSSGTGVITDLLRAWSQGQPEALVALAPAVESELRKLARSHLSRERGDHTLEPMELVNEAYLRLLTQNRVRWENRAQFFALAARIMRRVLVDHARRRGAVKRRVTRISLMPQAAAPGRESEPADVIALNDALVQLFEVDPRQAQIVELRYFGGLNVNETAEVLALSPSTVKREWRLARLWLYQEIRGR
jgi:RNA polymerase sigma factor (TIGR02999 family)